MASVLYKLTFSRHLSPILVSLFLIFLLPASVLLQEGATENNDLKDDYPTVDSSSNIEPPKIGNGSLLPTVNSSSTSTESTATTGNLTTTTTTTATSSTSTTAAAATPSATTTPCPPPPTQIPTIPCPAAISDETLEDIAELKSKINFMYIVTIVTLLFYLVNLGAGCFNICLKLSDRNNRSI